MIKIIKGQTNSVTLRLNDNVTITNPIYVFEFTCVQSRELFYCTPLNISTTTRYDQFNIYEITGTVESVSLTASTPKVALSYGGFYNYKIYQSSDYVLGTHSVVLDEGKMVYDSGELGSFFF